MRARFHYLLVSPAQVLLCTIKKAGSGVINACRAQGVDIATRGWRRHDADSSPVTFASSYAWLRIVSRASCSAIALYVCKDRVSCVLLRWRDFYARRRQNALPMYNPPAAVSRASRERGLPMAIAHSMACSLPNSALAVLNRAVRMAILAVGRVCAVKSSF